MPVVFQSPISPDQILFALRDLAGGDLTGMRISVAYATRAGCENLVGILEEKLGADALQAATKLLVTSFDFGHTDPEALRYWRELPNGDVRIANIGRTTNGRLSFAMSASNFHPKVYLFDHPDRTAALVGSANLTRRALTVNTEAANWEETADVEAFDRVWNCTWGTGNVLTQGLLDEYSAAQPNRPVPDLDSGIERQPIQIPGMGHRLIDAIGQGLNPAHFQFMWIQAGSMSSGGSQNQLELPRGANKYFGFNYEAYAAEHITIGEPVLISRGRECVMGGVKVCHAGGLTG